jgi:Tfp pilus assembly protein PilN
LKRVSLHENSLHFWKRKDKQDVKKYELKIQKTAKSAERVEEKSSLVISIFAKMGHFLINVKPEN